MHSFCLAIVSIMLAAQLMQQMGHIERGKVATLSQWCYLIAILF